MSRIHAWLRSKDAWLNEFRSVTTWPARVRVIPVLRSVAAALAEPQRPDSFAMARRRLCLPDGSGLIRPRNRRLFEAPCTDSREHLLAAARCEATARVADDVDAVSALRHHIRVALASVATSMPSVRTDDSVPSSASR